MGAAKTPYVHLKCSLDPEQVANRLKYQPDVVELQLFEQDIKDFDRIIETIHELRDHGVRPYLHHPMKVSGKYLDILSEDAEIAAFYDESCRVLARVCELEDVLCVVHPHYEEGCPSASISLEDSEALMERSEALAVAIEGVRNRISDRFLWENAPSGLFATTNPYWLSDIVYPTRIPLCYDVSHAFMGVSGSNEALLTNMRQAVPLTHYYHVVDSMGTEVHDGLALGEGRIDWKAIKPLIVEREFIFEIGLADQGDCAPMVASGRYFLSC